MKIIKKSKNLRNSHFSGICFPRAHSSSGENPDKLDLSDRGRANSISSRSQHHAQDQAPECRQILWSRSAGMQIIFSYLKLPPSWEFVSFISIKWFLAGKTVWLRFSFHALFFKVRDIELFLIKKQLGQAKILRLQLPRFFFMWKPIIAFYSLHSGSCFFSFQIALTLTQVILSFYSIEKRSYTVLAARNQFGWKAG